MPRKPEREPVEIEITVQVVTEKAILVVTDDADGERVEIWLPKSQIETDCWAVGDEGYAEVPHWLALEKNLIEDDDI